MIPADHLRRLMADDPRPAAEKADAAGMSRQMWHAYQNGTRTPGVDVAGRILIDGLGLPWAVLDYPEACPPVAPHAGAKLPEVP